MQQFALDNPESERMMPERRLWQMVVLQAIKDVMNKGFTNDSPSQRRAAKISALLFLCDKYGNLEDVCTFAGLSYDRVKALGLLLLEDHKAKRNPRKRLSFTYIGAQGHRR